MRVPARIELVRRYSAVSWGFVRVHGINEAEVAADKSAATFKVIDGVQYSFPGDWARVEAEGSITLLGRGSVCINTGGEKVFPEEV
jgi:acyl-CoA synthetase (AMP-forming)/AMP-acid ligase II